MTSEFTLIDSIKNWSSVKSKNVVCGIGDDAAVFKVRQGWYGLLTTDCLVEKVHFDWKYCSPTQVGFKALSVNVSDIAAMGGKPLWAVITIAFPQKTSPSRVREFYKGFNRATKLYGVTLVGGDLSRSSTDFWCSVTLYGEVQSKNCKLRSGAGVGDGLYVTGSTGLSALGLHLLRKNPKDSSVYARAHQMPVAQKSAGLFLGQQEEVTSMIDISDGLLADLGHILDQSKVGAEIRMNAIPCPQTFERDAKQCRVSDRELILGGGEAYQLLFTVEKKSEKAFQQKMKKQGFRFFKIGHIKAEKSSVKVLDNEGKSIVLKYKGYDHFK